MCERERKGEEERALEKTAEIRTEKLHIRKEWKKGQSLDRGDFSFKLVNKKRSPANTNWPH